MREPAFIRANSLSAQNVKVEPALPERSAPLIAPPRWAQPPVPSFQVASSGA